MSDVVLPTPSLPFLPPDILPPVILGCSVNLLAGAPGTGKTALLAWWIQQLQRQAPILSLPALPHVPYQAFIAADRSWDMSTRRWFDVQGVEPIPHYSLQDDRAFKKARLRKKQDRIAIFLECLEALAPSKGGQYPAGSLVYVDPLALFLGGNLLDYDTCLVACSELREIALDKGVTIIGTAHASKQKADKAERYLRLQDRILGSAALFGYTDTQIYLASPEETGREEYVLLWAPHHAKTQMFLFTRDEEGRFLPVDGRPLEADGSATLEDDPVPTDVPWLLALLDEPCEFHVLLLHAEQHEMSRATLARRLKALRAHGLVSMPKRGVYALAKPS